MANTIPFVEYIKKLPFDKKVSGLGAIMVIVSLVLPWYQDLDAFRTGYSFTGLTGPLSMAGISLLVFAALSIIAIVADSFGKKVPLMKSAPHRFHFVGGVFSVYLILLVASVYFNPNFGFNITMKQPQAGMYLAFIGSAFLIVGGLLGQRNTKKAVQGEPQQAVSEEPQKTEPVAEAAPEEPLVQDPAPLDRKPKDHLRFTPPARPSEAADVHPESLIPEEPDPTTPPARPASPRHQSTHASTIPTHRQPQVFRTDL